MSGLTLEQRDLIFDHSLGLASESEAEHAAQLIARSDQAADIQAKIVGALAPLENVAGQTCPDELVDRTVQRLCEVARERNVSPPSPEVIQFQRGRNWANAVAVAASIVFAVSVLIPASRLLRHQHQVRVCQGQMNNISRGLTSYSADHDDMFPALARPVGAPWNQVGYQGPENRSNSRNLYALLRLGYVGEPADFVCGHPRQARTPRLTPATINTFRDFPSRDHVTYSYRVMLDPWGKTPSLAGQPVLADMNPHFERSSSAFSAQMTSVSDREALQRNSANHGRRGQNVLYGDSHVDYVRTRVFGDPPDDIYRIESKDDCQGYEVPCCPTDTLLGP